MNTTLSPQELAKEYLRKLYTLFPQLLKDEKESKIEERDAIYAHSQTRIERLLTNYFKRLRPAREEYEN